MSVCSCRRTEAGYALVTGHGAERGREAAQDALVHGWRNWDQVKNMANAFDEETGWVTLLTRGQLAAQ